MDQEKISGNRMKKKDVFDFAESLKDFSQSVPIENLEDCLFVNLFFTLKAIKSHIDRICLGHNITGPQYNILRSLQANGGNATVKTIAAGMLSEGQGVTRLIDRLVQNKYLTRKRGTRDRRIVHVAFTEEGERFTNHLTKIIFSELKVLISHMKQNEIYQVITLLSKLRQFSE
jgi:DNA-binding MarR family transcriptional regulator